MRLNLFIFIAAIMIMSTVYAATETNITPELISRWKAFFHNDKIVVHYVTDKNATYKYMITNNESAYYSETYKCIGKCQQTINETKKINQQ